MDLRRGFRIGEFEVRPDDNVIRGPLGEVRIEPKSMDVFTVLADANGNTVAREKLIEAVWPRGYVSEDVLTRCVSQIRKALGDNTKSSRYLLTIRKRGYKLAQPVVALTASNNEAVEETPCILVLPFQSLSGQVDDAYIADGLTELITASLAASADLRVISRTTAMSFRNTADNMPEIARKTGANWVVEGSVLIDEDQVQVVMQLVAAREDAHVFAETYQTAVDALLDLQNEIANKISANVRKSLGVSVPAQAGGGVKMSEHTLRQYLKGRSLQSLRTVDSLRQAADCFSEVIREETDYADAYASLAVTRMLLAHYGAESVPDVRPTILRDLQRALSLEPENPLALYCRGATCLLFDRQLDAAEADLRTALSILPNHTMAAICLANICSARKDSEGALGWLQQALISNPLDIGLNMNIGDHLLLHGKYSAAVEQLRKALELDSSHTPSRLRLAWALALDGDVPAALAELERARDESGRTPALLEYSALVWAESDDESQALKQYMSLKQLADSKFVSPWSLARAAAAAGVDDDAFEHLEDAIKQGTTSLVFFGVTPAFRHLRKLPNGLELARRLLPA
jgi:TolB-like protein/Tfp pilus assembly protein PilF